MKYTAYSFLCFSLFLFLSSSQKGNIDLTSPKILEDRAYTTEKWTCDAKNRYFDWQCSYNQNYLQKDILNAFEKTFIFRFNSSDFNRDSYGFRLYILVNGNLRIRRSTRDFPFEITLLVPEGATLSVQTFCEKYPWANEDLSGIVNCKVLGD